MSVQLEHFWESLAEDFGVSHLQEPFNQHFSALRYFSFILETGTAAAKIFWLFILIIYKLYKKYIKSQGASATLQVVPSNKQIIQTVN